MKRTLVLFTTMYHRHLLTTHVFRHFQRIKTDLAAVLNLELLCAGSEGEKSRRIAEENGFHYIEVPNFPVSQKFNAAATACRNFNPDGVVYIGSDDILEAGIFNRYLRCIDDGIDFAGFRDIYYLSRQRLDYWKGFPVDSDRFGQPVGCGRFLSRRLMDSLEWRPWGDAEKNVSLDRLVEKNIAPHPVTSRLFSVKDPRSFMVDIKVMPCISRYFADNVVDETDMALVKRMVPFYPEVEHLLIDQTVPVYANTPRSTLRRQLSALRSRARTLVSHFRCFAP